MSNTTVYCGNESCRTQLKEEPATPKDEPNPCPNCNSLGRFFDLNGEESLALREMMDMKKRDPSRPSKRKLRIHLRQGDEIFVAENRWVVKVRRIDKDVEPAWYFELVTDPDSGDVIHHSSESLAEHFGHGSAKDKASPEDA